MVLSTTNMFKEVQFPQSRGALGTGFTYAPVLLFELYLAINNVEPAVNRQPGFRRELGEQITSFIMISQNFLHGELLKCKFLDPEVFDVNFHRNLKILSFFQHFELVQTKV